jgi:hypothetical protein
MPFLPYLLVGPISPCRYARVNDQRYRMTVSTGYTSSIALFRYLIPFLPSHSHQFYSSSVDKQILQVSP